MNAAIDLNCDLGESFGPYTIGMDDAVLPLVTSANIACGFHGGDPRVMERTVERAAELGIGIGAHVGYPDRVGFGRREIHATAGEVRTDVIYQIGALYAFCRALGVELQHVKPHGALYNQAARDAVLAQAVVAGIAAFDRRLIVLAPPGSQLARAAVAAGLPVALEGFADRGYNPDGSLVSRRQDGAVLHDPAEVAARALRMVREGKVRAVDGRDVTLTVQSLCIHGDNPASVSLARAVRQRLEAAGVAIRPLRAIVGHQA
ncbi:LamB/YcsF family protein [Thermaerobacter subterraneus]|uniref:5-oxoprolinase subunit A n=1 Tax=Thermaerobacter subterraneus DSM 13965 TaxID=867903 RepID=K6Q3C6_9FIRM|nr:5-oxoprolinase subunit PxpA [Thermaerobacter subterraneus]EKP95783.1 putative lactam utilization protein B-like protein [Thermaerobacter subterraneus DSM 13965]